MAKVFNKETAKIVYGATSKATALVIEDYPCGRGLTTTKYIWVETNKKGSRIVYQTINPRTGLLCKPNNKCTYSALYVLLQDDAGFVELDSLNTYPWDDHIQAFKDRNSTLDLEKLTEQEMINFKSAINCYHKFEDFY